MRGVFLLRRFTLLCALGLAGASEAQTLGPVPTPTVTRAPDAGIAFNSVTIPLPADFVEEEFFVEGTTSVGPFRTRILVRRPLRTEDFNGTVLVEWFNVSFNFDIDIEWPAVRDQVLRDGYAYVGVSVQTIGVNTLRSFNAPRYGTLLHPDPNPPTGNAQLGSFDIFSAVGKALRNGGSTGVDPLSGLVPRELIAVGQSQSAGRLGTYSQNIHNVQTEKLYDAFLLNAGPPTPRANVPTIVVNSELEVPRINALDPAAFADTASYRMWQVAGGPHTPVPTTQNVRALVVRDLTPGSDAAFPRCGYPLGITPSIPFGVIRIEYVLRAAVAQLQRWVRTGTPAPQAPLVETGPPTMVGTQRIAPILRDALGNARGGIRLPEVDAAVVRHVGVNLGAQCAVLYGFDAFDGNAEQPTTPPDPGDAPNEPASPNAVYASRNEYMRRYIASANRAVESGFILGPDARRAVRDALRSTPVR
jgi:hypothetical protein